MIAKIRQWITLKTRAARLYAANIIVRSLGCVTVSSDVLLQLVKKTAELASYIEKSGEIRKQVHAYSKLMSRVNEISSLTEAAVRIGDPNTKTDQLIQVYMTARWASMSRNQQRKYQRAQAAKEMAALPPKPPAATIAKPV